MIQCLTVQAYQIDECWKSMLVVEDLHGQLQVSIVETGAEGLWFDS